MQDLSKEKLYATTSLKSLSNMQVFCKLTSLQQPYLYHVADYVCKI